MNELDNRTPVLMAAVAIAMLAFQTVSAQDSVEISSITGQQSQVDLLGISKGQLVTKKQPIPLQSLLQIQTGRPTNERTAASVVLLSGGGQLFAEKIAFDGERFSITTSTVDLLLNPDSVRGILVDRDSERSRFDRGLNNRSIEFDAVVANTANGQRLVRGLIESIDDKRLMLNFDGKSRPISIDRVVGIITVDLKPKPAQGVRGAVRLTDGSVINAAVGDLLDGMLNLTLPGTPSVKIPFSSVASIALQSDRVIYLSDLEPVDFTANPLATLDFEWQRNKSVSGNPIRLYSPKTGRDIEYAKGIGTHAASRIEFENSQGFDEFSTVVGIDSETNGKGNCLVSVWADDIKLWESEIRGNREPETVNLDITGMKRIALVVREGKHLDLGDHVDWADARLLKTKD